MLPVWGSLDTCRPCLDLIFITTIYTSSLSHVFESRQVSSMNPRIEYCAFPDYSALEQFARKTERVAHEITQGVPAILNRTSRDRLRRQNRRDLLNHALKHSK